MKKLMIIGASGHGKVIEDIARLNGYQKITYLDDRWEELKMLGMNVLGKCSAIPLYINEYQFAIGIGNNLIRKKYYDIIHEKNGDMPILIHPNAVVSSNVKLEAGTCVMANAVISTGCEIGKACVINTAATIDHECKLDNCVHISPGVHLAGNVSVGELSWIGIGSCVIQGIVIGKYCIVGAGAVVIRKVSDNTNVVGNPAQILK
ncbi:acetyltransferase [Lachnotalea glycerini]|uniref:Acetyltransferase n=1 Tax=Lachnotalea glycerini TaxID=1763509 RepID=A0A371JG45_9FIRM|nr:acetyltransferase [Lachnotalea glycerini]RDY31720.1 acetyltransferase [Lachnotalea glycerini]